MRSSFILRYWPAILWWEQRRIPFNLLVLLTGLATLFVIYALTGTYVKPGDDLIEPFLLYSLIAFYAGGVNLFYSLGWVSEILWSGGNLDYTAPLRWKVFLLGTAFSLFTTLMPAIVALIIWVFVKLH